MFNWTFTFLILALVTGVLGFSSLAGAFANIAQILSVLFLGLMIVSLISREMGRRGM
jgi:uncharacterized membrane protein YtjA (UPF0391 family)